MRRLGIIGSGKGSNCQTIIDAIEAGRLEASVGCVLSDCEDAKILERAHRAQVPAHFVDCGPYRTKLDGEGQARVLSLLREHGVDLVILAGFMRMVKQGLLDAFPRRILNIHPSLLPAFPGLDAWGQALAYGVKVTGCTVHFVDAGMDTGPIIVQRTVPVLDGDTPETLHARIQEQEVLAYPEAIALVLADRTLFSDGRALEDGRTSS